MKKNILIGIDLIIILLFTLFLTSCQRTYKVTFEIYEDTSEYQIIEKGAKIENFTPVLEGYTFSCWLYEDNIFDENIPITDNITLTAEWIKNDYEIIFENDGKEYKKLNLEYGDLINEIEEPKKEDYIFLGWYDGDTLFTFETKVTKALTLKAKWVKDSEYIIPLEISFNSTGAKVEIENIKLNRLDKMPSLPAVSFEGREFLGWYVNGKKYNEGDIVTEIEDFTLIAKWK